MPALSPISVQLWSVREPLRAHLAGTLARLAGIGFTLVEPFDLFTDPEGLRSAMAANGLRAPSTHASVTRDRTPDEVFAAAASLAIGTVVEPMIAESRWETRDGIAGIADELNAAAGQAAAHGVRLGYHNHAFELSTMVEGRPALEVFAELSDPAIVLEVDTYWAAVGGQDVPALLRRLGDRVRLLHLKDGPFDKVDEHQLPIGQGRLPVWPIVAAAPALEVPVIEFDAYAGDIFEGLSTAFGYASAGPPAT